MRDAGRIGRRLLLALLLLGSGAAQAQVSVVITGDVAVATINLSSGGENYSATLRLQFDQPQNLTEACLGISAEVLGPSAIAAIDARFPDPARLEIDTDFPLRIEVEPPPGCGLAFVNDVVIELTTADLDYAAFSPYRLMKAPIGGAFADITAAVEEGSIRARGRGGSFSEFVIAEDLVQAHGSDAALLLDRLADQLDDPDIALSVRTSLETELSLVASAFDSGQLGTARQRLVDFDTELRGFAGAGLPNGFLAGNPIVNEAGELLGISGALGFALARLDGAP